MDEDGTKLWRNTELANSLNAMIENQDIYSKQIKLFAELRWEKYLALIEAGFSDEQALFLIEKTPVLM